MTESGNDIASVYFHLHAVVSYCDLRAARVVLSQADQPDVRHLLVPQRDHRIEPRRAPCRQHARYRAERGGETDREEGEVGREEERRRLTRGRGGGDADRSRRTMRWTK